MTILFVILITILVLISLLYLFANVLLNFLFGKRCEGNPNLKYFTADDFEELNATKIEFKSDKGQSLRGYIYQNNKIKEKDIKGLLVFVHGMGAGHFSYTTEINTLAKNGYKVLAYDNTGTCMSEGKKLNGFYQAVIDLKHCLEYIKSNNELNNYNLGLIGHSWGAYTVCQSLKYKSNVKAVVGMSGPDTLEKLITSSMGKFGKIINPFLRKINEIKFGKEVLDSSVDVLKNADDSVSILLLHGEDDSTCRIENSMIFNQEEDFKEKENINTIMFEGKNHNIYQTIESEKYLIDVFKTIEEYKKNIRKDSKNKEIEETLKTYYKNIDYKKITEEDPDVMEIILEFFNNTIDV